MTVQKLMTISSDGEDKTAEFHEFASSIGLERAAPGRYSLLLVLQLYGGFTARRLNPAKVVAEIEALENSTKTSHTKPPLQFKYAPLKGLWHKHFLADGLSTFARNLKNGLYKDGLPLFENRVREAQEAGEERYVTPDDIKAIINDAVHGNWMRRSSAGELTGDWIIYAQHDGANYYLSLGTHDSGDQNLRDQIDALCCKEFPFLTDMLE